MVTPHPLTAPLFACEFSRPAPMRSLPTGRTAAPPLLAITSDPHHIAGPFVVTTLPEAALLHGWPAETRYGARLALAQLPVVSGWLWCIASLATLVLLTWPLLYLPTALAAALHAALAPICTVFRALSMLADEVVVAVAVLLIDAVAVLQCVVLGGAMPEGGLPALLAVGPKALAAAEDARDRSAALRLAYTAAWSPLKEELIFRCGLQRALARVRLPRRAGSNEWRIAASPGARRASRLAAGAAFGLAHLPPLSAVGAPAPTLFAHALPGGVAAYLCATRCFGLLYERRGLPAALGAHAGHNLLMSTMAALDERLVARVAAPAWLRGALIPAAVYGVLGLRWWVRRRSRRQRETSWSFEFKNRCDESRGL